MAKQTNIGQAFPLESLGSDIARNSFNYQSILGGLIEWDKTNDEQVIIRLAKDSDPYYEDFIIPSKKSVFDLNSFSSQAQGLVSEYHFAIDSALDVAYYGGTQTDPNDSGDIVTVRVTVTSNGGVPWHLYYSPMAPEWTSGGSYRMGNYVKQGHAWYKVLNDITSSVTAPSADPINFSRFDMEWVENASYAIGDIVKRNGSLYIAEQAISTSATDPSGDSHFGVYAQEWVSGQEYKKGSIVAYSSGALTLTYIAKYDVSSTDTPMDDTENWTAKLLLKNPYSGDITSSTIVRWTADVDIDYLILRNASTIMDSTEDVDLMLRTSIKTKEPESIYQRSVSVLPSSNYVRWPTDKSSIWSDGDIISPTNSSLNIRQRQPYSSVMVFNHIDSENAKTINFINYDGPDLDQGLCIYLPVESDVGSGGLAHPEDGFTFEFYIRIWPNVNYTDAVTRDHIVNKAQVYVYNAPNVDAVDSESCSDPIAKFSMARMTNYYTFGENISIPDKPVIYRATFVYSHSQNQWMTLDYYQLPDHVFMGPVGFVDPANPGNLDVNADMLGGINPNAAFIGYETGAFPTFSDVFSNPDLSPYRPDSMDEFINRTI